MKNIIKLADEADELSFGAYTIDTLQYEAKKWIKKIEKSQKDSNVSLKVGKHNISCYPDERFDKDEDNCFLIKTWIKYFFDIGDEK